MVTIFMSLIYQFSSGSPVTGFQSSLLPVYCTVGPQYISKVYNLY